MSRRKLATSAHALAHRKKTHAAPTQTRARSRSQKKRGQAATPGALVPTCPARTLNMLVKAQPGAVAACRPPRPGRGVARPPRAGAHGASPPLAAWDHHRHPGRLCRPAAVVPARRRLLCRPPGGILDSYRAASSASSAASDDGGDDDDLDDDGLDACPIDCVTEVETPEDLDAILADVAPSTLVVVDYYKTACGACRYVAPGFVKLCKAAGKAGTAAASSPDVVFLKHNVEDDEDGRTPLAVREGIRNVPTFQFLRDKKRVETFPTRDRAVIAAAVNRLVGREVL